MEDRFELSRFVNAQAYVYESVKKELLSGHKESHWMWYIFPQLKCLGKSQTALYYGITNKDELLAYCNNDILYNRYIECLNILLDLETNDPVVVLGSTDARKLLSSVTLFSLFDDENEELYDKIVKKYFNGKYDEKTIAFFDTSD